MGSLSWFIVLFVTVLANLEDGLKKASYPTHPSPALTVLTQLGLPPISNSLGEAGTKWNQEREEIQWYACYQCVCPSVNLLIQEVFLFLLPVNIARFYQFLIPSKILMECFSKFFH